MAILANPASYLTTSQFRGMIQDFDLSGYTDAQIQDKLVRASGVADSILRRSLLAREYSERVIGDGSNRIELHVNPLLYVKRVEIVVPGVSGTYIPVNQLLLDFKSGSVMEYTPMFLNGIGYFAQFPRGASIDFLIGTGYGLTFSAPAYTIADNAGTLTPGTYNLAVTTRTMWGETTSTVKQFTTALGGMLETITPVLGAYVYRAYISSAVNNTTLNGATLAAATSFVLTSVGTIAVGDVLLFDSGANAEYLTVATVNAGTKTITTTTGALYAHANTVAVIPRPMLVNQSPYTAYGSIAMQIAVTSLTAQQGLWQDPLPLSDTSSPPLPQAINEAVRLLTLGQILEDNNLANRGVYKTESGKKSVMWRSTEGSSGKGTPLFYDQAAEWLKPYSFIGVF